MALDRKWYLGALAALPLALGTGPVAAQEYDNDVVDNYDADLTDVGLYDDSGLWETDNWENDDYGVYDTDFDWETTDPGFDAWYGDGYEATATNDENVESAHYRLLGFDDAGDWGAWDW